MKDDKIFSFLLDYHLMGNVKLKIPLLPRHRCFDLSCWVLSPNVTQHHPTFNITQQLTHRQRSSSNITHHFQQHPTLITRSNPTLPTRRYPTTPIVAEHPNSANITLDNVLNITQHHTTSPKSTDQHYATSSSITQHNVTLSNIIQHHPTNIMQRLPIQPNQHCPISPNITQPTLHNFIQYQHPTSPSIIQYYPSSTTTIQQRPASLNITQHYPTSTNIIQHQNC